MAAAVAAPLPLEAAKPVVCAQCVKANLEKLAGDELRGRGCGTEDEHAAARFVADTLKRYKIAPAVDGYLMPVAIQTPTAAQPPTLTVAAGAAQVTLTHGKEIV